MQLLWKTARSFLRNSNIEVPYDPGLSLLRIHPKELKARSQRAICTPMFEAISFMIAKKVEASQVSSERYGQNVFYTYNGMVFKRKEMLTHAMT